MQGRKMCESVGIQAPRSQAYGVRCDVEDVGVKYPFKLKAITS